MSGPGADFKSGFYRRRLGNTAALFSDNRSMSCKRKGKQTVEFAAPPSIIASAGVAGKKEGEGPLAKSFDHISEDPYFGERSWEKAESAMQRLAFTHALNKAGLSPSSIQYIFASGNSFSRFFPAS